MEDSRRIATNSFDLAAARPAAAAFVTAAIAGTHTHEAHTSLSYLRTLIVRGSPRDIRSAGLWTALREFSSMPSSAGTGVRRATGAAAGGNPAPAAANGHAVSPLRRIPAGIAVDVAHIRAKALGATYRSIPELERSQPIERCAPAVLGAQEGQRGVFLEWLRDPIDGRRGDLERELLNVLWTTHALGCVGPLRVAAEQEAAHSKEDDARNVIAEHCATP